MLQQPPSSEVNVAQSRTSGAGSKASVPRRDSLGYDTHFGPSALRLETSEQCKEQAQLLYKPYTFKKLTLILF